MTGRNRSASLNKLTNSLNFSLKKTHQAQKSSQRAVSIIQGKDNSSFVKLFPENKNNRTQEMAQHCKSNTASIKK